MHRILRVEKDQKDNKIISKLALVKLPKPILKKIFHEMLGINDTKQSSPILKIAPSVSRYMYSVLSSDRINKEIRQLERNFHRNNNQQIGNQVERKALVSKNNEIESLLQLMEKESLRCFNRPGSKLFFINLILLLLLVLEIVNMCNIDKTNDAARSTGNASSSPLMNTMVFMLLALANATSWIYQFCCPPETKFVCDIRSDFCDDIYSANRNPFLQARVVEYRSNQRLSRFSTRVKDDVQRVLALPDRTHEAKSYNEICALLRDQLLRIENIKNDLEADYKRCNAELAVITTEQKQKQKLQSICLNFNNPNVLYKPASIAKASDSECRILITDDLKKPLLADQRSVY